MKKYKGLIETVKTIALVAVLACLAGFVGGISYEKSNSQAIQQAVQTAQAQTQSSATAEKSK